MRIAIVSYEYPPDTGGGGIGTYVQQAAKMLRSREHDVEVFCGTRAESYDTSENGVALHKVKATDQTAFPQAVATPFARVHDAHPFDVIESAEFGADAREIRRNFPALPLVVKLHTPSYLVGQLNSEPISLVDKARFMLGGLVRGRINTPYWKYDVRNDEEHWLTRSAEVVVSPSRDLARIVARDWQLPISDIRHLPNCFTPSDAFLQLELPDAREEIVIAFVGRLERRKGIFTLMEAIPDVLRQQPNVRFHFIGKPLASPKPAIGMDVYLQQRLHAFANRLTFINFIPREQLPAALGAADICVFPSLWENFPYVCLEAMAAGRAVVGSSAGGMADMLGDDEFGLLVEPDHPQALATTLVRLARDRALRLNLGRKARQRVLSAYGEDTIAPLQEDAYRSAIARHMSDDDSHRSNLKPSEMPL